MAYKKVDPFLKKINEEIRSIKSAISSAEKKNDQARLAFLQQQLNALNTQKARYIQSKPE